MSSLTSLMGAGGGLASSLGKLPPSLRSGVRHAAVEALNAPDPTAPAAARTTPTQADGSRGQVPSSTFQLEFSYTSVAISVNAASSQGSQNSAPQGSNHGSRDDVLSRFADLDPKLAKDLQALLDFLDKQNPRVAKFLEKSLSLVAGAMGGSSSSAPPASIDLQVPTSITPPTADAVGQANAANDRISRIQIAIEATVVDLKAQLNEGVEITAEVIQMSFSVNLQGILGKADPLVLDLDNNGLFDTTTAQEGHLFDIAATGQSVRSATAAGGDYMLALDRNANGQIDDGSELFGDQNGAADGFAELAKHDENGDGVIDSSDSVFSKLSLFQDSNRNGATDFGELRSLADFQIAALSLQSLTASEASSGNEVTKTGSFVRDDGSKGRVGDLLFNYLA